MEQINKTRTIYVLLTAYSDFLSLLVRLVTFGRYTHASVGIEEYSDKFFSFVTKGGFHIERPLNSRRAKKRALQCALYRLEVNDEVYVAVKEHLALFNSQAKQYRYSFLGLLFCIIRIPHKHENRYFCSQFVSELLMSSGATRLQKRSCLYLPDDFRYEPGLKLCYKGTLGELSEFI